MKYFIVKVKQHCSACPCDGGCKQCNGKGWYYTEQRVCETEIMEGVINGAN